MRKSYCSEFPAKPASRGFLRFMLQHMTRKQASVLLEVLHAEMPEPGTWRELYPGVRLANNSDLEKAGRAGKAFCVEYRLTQRMTPQDAIVSGILRDF